MTKEVITCLPGDSVRHVAELMREYHVGSLPVVDNDDQRTLLGVITDRDIVIRVVAEQRDPASTNAGDVMTSDVVTCRPADDLAEAASRMMERRIRRLFITKHGRVLGVIAQADIASRGGERDVTAQLVERVSQPVT